jgi:LacI family transcriptional regulator
MRSKENDQKRVTSFDVARAAGVSQSTVSRALRGDPRIGEETARRVAEFATALDYVPSERARALSTRATRRIAMVVDLDNPLWSILVRSLHDELSLHGYQLTLIADHGDHVDFEPLVTGGAVDGVIVSTVTLSSQVPAMLKHRGIPAVLLHRWSQQSDLDSCVADDNSGGRQAAQILLDSGHRRVAALFGPSHASTARDRAAGFRAGLADAGIELPASRVREGGFEYSYGWEALPHLMTGRHPPTAVFCSNDVIAMGALNAAYARGIRVPDDLAIVGFDDLQETARPTVNLTTIHVPFHDMLRSAVTLLLERVGGYDGGGRRVIHPVTPVLRGTHGGVPVGGA